VLVHEGPVEPRLGAPRFCSALLVSFSQDTHGVSSGLEREVLRPPEKLVSTRVADPVKAEENPFADLDRLRVE
jgi:hypothetical protein